MTETQKRIKELREAILIKVEDRKAEVSYTEELIDALIAKVKEVQIEADATILDRRLNHVDAAAIRGTG